MRTRARKPRCYAPDHALQNPVHQDKKGEGA